MRNENQDHLETGIYNQIIMIMKTYHRHRPINLLKNFFGVKLQGGPPRSLLQCLVMAVMVMVSTSVGRSQVVVQNLGTALAVAAAAWPTVVFPATRERLVPIIDYSNGDFFQGL